MSGKTNYKEILNSEPEKVIQIFQNLDKINYLETIIIPKLSKIQSQSKIQKSLENDIYLSILLIKYKNDLQTNIIETILSKNQKEFSYIFNYIITDSIKQKTDFIKKEICLIMLNICIDNIYINFIKTELTKLCSIFIWVNLTKEKLRLIFNKDKSLLKNFLALSQMNKVKEGGILDSIYCCFINDLLEDIINFFEKINLSQVSYINKGILLLISFLGINNMRKFLLPLLEQKHFIERFNLFIIELKENKTKKNFMEFDENKEINNDIVLDLEKIEFLFNRFYYYYFYENISYDELEKIKEQNKEFENMQKKLYKLYPDKMKQLLNVNFIFSDNRKNLIELISYLSKDELYIILKEENLINYPKKYYFDSSIKIRSNLLQEIFINKYIKKNNLLEQILSLPLYPNESLLIPEKNNLLPNYYSITDFKSSIDIPKLSYTYLSLYDYLLKNYYLYKYESSYEISIDLENCLDKMDPSFDPISGKFLLQFNSWSLYGYPILDFQILNVQSPLVGGEYPRQVVGEISYDLNGVQPEIRKEWEKFKKYDTIFLIYLHKDINKIIIRGAEIDSIYDEENKNILLNNEFNENDNNDNIKGGFKRRMMVHLDPVQYTHDLKNGFISNLNFHMIMRRKPKENNFKSILFTIKSLIKDINSFPQNFANIILNNSFLSKDKNINNISTDNNKIKISNGKIKFNEKQIEAINLGIKEGLCLIKGPPGTGKTDIAVEIINYLYQNKKNEKILIITHSNNVLNEICQKIVLAGIVDIKHLLRLGQGNENIILNQDDNNINIDLSLDGQINYALEKRKKFLQKFLDTMISNNIKIYNEYTCQSALALLDFYFTKKNENSPKNDLLQKNIESKMNLTLEQIISELKQYLIYELLRDQTERKNYIISSQSKIIALTSTYSAINRQKLISLNLSYDTVLFEESGQILEIESFIPLTLQKNLSKLKRVILLGDENQLPPIVKNQGIRTQCLYHLSLFNRLIKAGYKNCITLNEQGRSRSEIVDLYRYKYDNLIDMKDVIKSYPKKNFGFKYNVQFINVEEFNSKGEEINSNNSYYNLPEAEYCIGIYMYMCLVGYTPENITILCTYKGQKELIKEIYNKKCTWNKLFTGIKKISTVDKYQGQQNDYIILSLVRTKKIGYLRDIRRFIVSLSRARKGLIILGKWDLFSNCIELSDTFNVLKDKFNFKSKKLEICLEGKKKEDIVIEDFKHMYRLGQELLKIAMDNNDTNEINDKNE